MKISFKAICLLFLIFKLMTSLNLIADTNNQLMVNPPSKNSGTKFMIKFSFPTVTPNAIGPYANGSPGLQYKQFFGLSFPSTIASDLSFDATGDIKFGCALTDGTYTYTVTPVKPVASPITQSLNAESSIAYCQLDDTSANVPLKTVAGTIYTLTITVNVKFPSNFLRSITLFTSTSNNPEKIIIDSIPVIGTVALYNDITTITSSKPLDISSGFQYLPTANSVPKSTSDPIYPLNVFDVTLQLQANTYITAVDHIIVIEYPKSCVSPPTTVLSTPVSTTSDSSSTNLQRALEGNLSIKAFGTDTNLLYIDGITEDLVKDRLFYLTLKGWKALDTDINKDRDIIVSVYYKNTYTIISRAAKTVFKVSKTEVTLTFNHPEFWNVYQSGAYPLSFTFNAKNDITAESWVVLQQVEAVEPTGSAGNKLSFIASTCDFSVNKETSLFDNGFGKRYNCFPLRKDMEYPGKKEASYNGSGIFFYMKNAIVANKDYKFTVWAFFDSCGGTDAAAKNILGTNYTSPKVKLTIYKNMNPSLLNEQRFTVDTNNNPIQVIGDSSSTTFGGKCYNNIAWGATADQRYATTPNTILASGTNNPTTNAGIINYQEVFNWNVVNVASITPPNSASDLFSDLSSDTLTQTASYIYNVNSGASITGSYFAAYFKFYVKTGTCVGGVCTPGAIQCVGGAGTCPRAGTCPATSSCPSGNVCGDNTKTCNSGDCVTTCSTTTCNSSGAGVCPRVGNCPDSQTCTAGNVCSTLGYTCNSGDCAGTCTGLPTSATCTGSGASGTCDAGSAPKLYTQLALPVITPAAPAIPPGKIFWQFPSTWFVQGKSFGTGGTCFASWGLGTKNNMCKTSFTGGVNVCQKSLTPPLGDAAEKYAYSTATLTKGADNFISVLNSLNTSQIDASLTKIPTALETPTGASGIYQLVSIFNPGTNIGTTTTGWTYFADAIGVANLSGAKGNVGYFTNCFKWVTTLPAVTSMYSYIDIQFKFHYMSSSSGTDYPLTNMRFITLFPEAGVFQDVSKNPLVGSNPITSLSNSFISHTIYTSITTPTESICLIEVNGKNITSLKETGYTGTLVIWIFYGTLLETDYKDPSSTYPVAPLISAISVYGLQSAPAFSNVYPMITYENTITNTAFQKELSPYVPESLSVSTTDYPPALSTNTSSYKFFMGSVLYFTSVSGSNMTVSTSGSVETAFYIPYYCPKIYWDTTQAATKALSFLPLFMATWMKDSTAYNAPGSVNKYVPYKKSTSNSDFAHLVIPNKSSSGNALSTPLLKTANAGNDGNGTVQTATLKWTSYPTPNDQFLYVYNGKVDAAGSADVTCTGTVLLLTNDITVDTTTLAFSGFNSNAIGYYPGTKIFYALGKAFQKAIFTGLNDTDPPSAANFVATKADGATTSGTNGNSANYYTGIKRPTADSFYNTTLNQLVLYDKIAFSCAAVNNNVFNGLNNYIKTNDTGYFLLDWYKFSGSGWTAASALTYDKAEPYLDDPASNFKLTITPPVLVPLNTEFKITGNGALISSNSICGIMNGSGIVSECKFGSGSMRCKVPIAGNTFTVCCYNILHVDPIQLSALTAEFITSSKVSQSLMTLEVYSASAQISSYSFPTANSAKTKAGFATVSGVTYSHVYQEAGIGKVTFTVALQREPTRNMKLSFTTNDLTGMLISGNIPRCVAGFNKDNFGSPWETGDILIDTCSVSGISTTTPIVITTKNILYKCGLSFAKTLYVNLWPVVVVNWNTAPNRKFTITMNLNTDVLTATPQPGNDLTLSPALAAKPTPAPQWDTLCSVKDITPKIPGEIADYTFEFDLETSSKTIGSIGPNEVTIFWPYQYYGSFLQNIFCYYNNIMQNCSFTEEGILNVRFGTPLTIGAKHSIVIVGVQNPAIDGNYSFPCTVNNTVFSSGLRTNLLIGSGKLTGGITLDLNTVTVGGLRFYSVTDFNQDKNPRNLSVHKFRFAFDNAVGLTPDIVEFDSASPPILHIYFPSDYKLAWYANNRSSASNPTATVTECTMTNQIKTTSSIQTSLVGLSGNRMTISFPNNPTKPYSFNTSTWKYWEISIQNIVNPTDSTNQPGPPPTQTTRPFYIILTNSSLTKIYRTHTNVNTYFSLPLTNKVDQFLAYNKGMAFEFDQNKWVIDTYAVSTQLNIMTVKAGRYLQAFLNVKSNTSTTIQPQVTTISLTDTTFKLLLSTYTLYTSFSQPLPIYIGCACGTAPGYYLVNFTSSEQTMFASLSPVIITVDTSMKGTITFQTPGNIPAGGSAMVSILLSEPNVDLINLQWAAADNTTNDPTAKLSTVSIPAGTITSTSTAGSGLPPIFAVFSITSSSALLGAQIFKPTAEPNACYSWSSPTVSFTISGSTAIIASGLNITPNFKFVNSDSDTALAKNAIKFTFTPPAAPIYIYCALACLNLTYPTDADIIAGKSDSSNGSFLKFYKNIIVNTTAIDIIFSDLIRGQQYHMRCIIQSTQGDTTLRTSSSANIENYTPPAASGTGSSSTTTPVTVPISPGAPLPAQSIVFNFLSEPGLETRRAIVNYCQRIFSSGGYQQNGYIICSCSDEFLTYTVPGLTMPSTVICPSTLSRSILRFLADTTSTSTGTIVPPTVQDVPTTFVVSISQNPRSSTDPNLNNKTFNDLVQQFNNDLKSEANFRTKLGITNVRLNPTTPTTIISDSVAPDINNVKWTATLNQAGDYTVQASATTPLVCYYQITTATTATAISIMSCTDTSRCGKSKVNSTQTTIKSGTSKAFDKGSTQNIFVVCQNDIIGAQKQSAVKNMYSVKIPEDTVVPTTTTTTSSSNFIGYSILVIFLALILIFN